MASRIHVLLLVAGCNQASSEPTPRAKTVEGTAAPSAKLTDTHAAINTLVPRSLAGKLTFERRELEDQFKNKYTAYLPATWVQNEGFASLHPPDEDTWGSAMRLSITCAGVCVAKDWAAVTDKEEFASMRDAEILEDTKTATSRLMIAKANDVTAVAYAWWADGASRYSSCSASLKSPYRDAVPAFVKACQTAATVAR